MQIRQFIKLDFPTLDLPAKATSGKEFSGSLLVIPHTVSKIASLIIIICQFSELFGVEYDS